MTTTDEIQENLEKIAYSKTTAFCYGCYIKAPKGVCPKCHSDDLMRELEGVGVEYGVQWVIDSMLGEELEEVDMDERYHEMLEECYPEGVNICGMLMGSQADMLRKCDPIAYRCGLSDYISSEIDESIYEDNKGNYYGMYKLEEFINTSLDSIEEQEEDL
jgi:hypothetical protein